MRTMTKVLQKWIEEVQAMQTQLYTIAQNRQDGMKPQNDQKELQDEALCIAKRQRKTGRDRSEISGSKQECNDKQCDNAQSEGKTIPERKSSRKVRA